MRFLQKFNIYIYLIFLIFLFCFTPKTYAYVNDNTSWNLSIPNYDEFLRNTFCGNNGSMYDVVNDFIDNISTEYYTLVVGAPRFSNSEVSSIPFYIKWKSSIEFNRLYYYGHNTNPPRLDLVFKYSNDTARVPYYLLKNTTCSSYQNNSDYQMFKNLTDTGDYSQVPSLGIGDFEYNNYTSPNFDDYRYFTSFSNDLSYDTDNWFYYTSTDFTYYYVNPNNNSFYNKKLCIVGFDSCYVNNDILPSYYDLYHNSNSSTFIGYKTSLDTFYTSIPVNNVSNYSLSFSFKVPQSLLGSYQTTQEYINNTNFNYICSGRINNTNYYNYESFPCSLSSSYSSTSSSITYNFNNFSTNSSLTNFDKIYITIDSKYLDSNINTTIFDLSYNYNLGDFYNTTYKGSIYEKLTNLPLNFRLYLSSNNSLQDSNLFVRKYNFINYNIKYIGFSNNTQQQNLVIGNSILGSLGNDEPVDFISTQVSNNIDTGIMIFQENSSILLPNLDLFFNGGVVLSFNYNSNSDSFYYVDNTGSIQNSDFIKPIYTTDTSKYDISYYIGQINSFINDLSNDTLQFASLTQSFYNSIPLFFQTFIFVIFILFCIYFIYLLIKR